MRRGSGYIRLQWWVDGKQAVVRPWAAAAASLIKNAPSAPAAMMITLAILPGVALITQAVVKFNAEKMPPTVIAGTSGSMMISGSRVRRRNWRHRSPSNADALGDLLSAMKNADRGIPRNIFIPHQPLDFLVERFAIAVVIIAGSIARRSEVGVWCVALTLH
jgi:hypothetical protein